MHLVQRQLMSLRLPPAKPAFMTRAKKQAPPFAPKTDPGVDASWQPSGMPSTSAIWAQVGSGRRKSPHGHASGLACTGSGIKKSYDGIHVRGVPTGVYFKNILSALARQRPRAL